MSNTDVSFQFFFSWISIWFNLKAINIKRQTIKRFPQNFNLNEIFFFDEKRNTSQKGYERLLQVWHQ